MHINIALEGKYENHFIAWALDFPGCFGYGADEQEAIIHFPQDFLAYQNWINFKAGIHSWVKDIRDFDIRLVESFKNFYVNDQLQIVENHGKMISSWFQNDQKPLIQTEIEQALEILKWSRKDFLDLWDSIPPTAMDIKFPDERWTIAEIFQHVANAEWWYLDRLGQAKYQKKELPQSPLEKLAVVRENLVKVLPEFENIEFVQKVEGEIWSPRKLVRRSIWHEKDHLVHIQKLMSLL